MIHKQTALFSNTNIWNLKQHFKGLFAGKTSLKQMGNLSLFGAAAIAAAVI